MSDPVHVLITGAAGAIGGALARRMRAAWPVARLALLDRDADAVRGLAGELGNATATEADTLAESWRPWRSYAVMHLWRMAAARAASVG